MRTGLILGLMIFAGGAGAAALAAATGPAGADAKPLEVVPFVDIQKYLGTLY
jgi:hypothetical protein